MWFQHDGCSEHYSMVAREVLDPDFNGHWIDRDGPVNWPDLSSPDLFLWGYLKDKVTNKNQQHVRIQGYHK